MIAKLVNLITLFGSTHISHVPGVSLVDFISKQLWMYEVMHHRLRLEKTLSSWMNTRHSLVAACRRSVDMNSEQMLMQLDTVEFAIRNYPAVTLNSERIIFLVIKNPGKVLVYTFPHLLANIHWRVLFMIKTLKPFHLHCWSLHAWIWIG